MTDGSVQVLGFAGSLRAGSFNRMLLRAAQALAPAQVNVTIHDLAPIPLYNFDVEQQGDPEPVRVFKENIAAADAVLVVTPEYQQGVPGVLKNALDWASRPPGKSALRDKPVAIMGATPGRMMTVRAQTQLRQMPGYNSCFLVSHSGCEPIGVPVLPKAR
jgi:chromate reductase